MLNFELMIFIIVLRIEWA